VGARSQRWACVGKDAGTTLRERKSKAAALELKRGGVEVAEPASQNRRSLISAITEYSAEVAAQKSHRTAKVYSYALTRFQRSCKKKNLSDVVRSDLMEFISFLRNEGLSDRTVHNGVERILTFLRWCGITGLLSRNDKPKFTAKKVDAYDDTQLAALYAASTDEERLLWQFFVYTGMREGEVAHVYYTDVNHNSKVKTVSVTENLSGVGSRRIRKSVKPRFRIGWPKLLPSVGGGTQATD